MSEPFRIAPAGDSTLVIEFEERIDPEVNARVVRLAEAIGAARMSGVRDIVPTYRSVAVFFDPVRFDHDLFIDWINRKAGESDGTAQDPGAVIRVPVCYGGDLGPDLEAVTRFARLSPQEVTTIHAGTTYRVFMMGFVPGFAYMGMVDARIAVPRLPMPRVRVPRGSVGIAGEQTGVYPADTAGGWHIIGRTPVRPFDASRPNPFLFAAGDSVQFVPIDRAAYDRIVESGLRA
jgi:KipI family sensor histidine kinase inhibitor